MKRTNDADVDAGVATLDSGEQSAVDRIMKKASAKRAVFVIDPPNFQTVEVRIRGTAPLMIHKFSAKARKQIEAAQTAEHKVKQKRPPKNYKAEFEGARYRAREGWDGFYAGCIRNAMIGAIRFVDGITMVKAKGLFFVEADGRDREDGTPLVRIIGKQPEHDTRPARNENGSVDMRNRPRYDDWEALLRIRFDADAISMEDVLNLLARAGQQVGIGDGRPGSPNSNGMGFGLFDIVPSGASKRAKPAPKSKAWTKPRRMKPAANDVTVTL